MAIARREAREAAGQLECLTRCAMWVFSISDPWCLAGVDPKTLVTVVGDLPHAMKGQQLRFVGDWVLHPKHSWQLKATAYEEVVPQSPQAVAAYLASTIEGEGLPLIELLRHRRLL